MRIKTIILSLVLISFLVTGGYAMIQTITLEELTTEAEIIGIATLKISNKMPIDKDGVVKIQSTIVFSEVLKGEVKSGDEVVIETSEGFEDMPLLEPRNRFIVFLNKAPNGNVYLTTNLIQGYWPLDKDGKPLGMGLGTTKAQLEEAIKKTKDQKPSQKTPGSDAPIF